MTLIYNFGIGLYYILVLIASVFNKKARLWIKGRRRILTDLKTKREKDAEYAWFHVSSLGEFEQGRPIMEELKKKFPDIKILLTFFSPSGYEIRKNYEYADLVYYLPLDTRYNAKRFVSLANPKWTFFIKYEYWYNFLKEVKKTDSKLYLVSGIFRPGQLFFKWYGGWYRKILGWFDHFYVQNDESARMLNSIGLKNHTISGDSRFDRVLQIANSSKNIEIASAFSENAQVIIAGSTWEPDEDLLINYMLVADAYVKCILAPHEINSTHINQITKKIKVPYALFSQAANMKDLKSCRILIVDNIGMLSSLYKYGSVAYIGGGFGAGIHNVLEAAVYGMPVIHGPNYQKFHEAVMLINKGGGFCIKSNEELNKLFGKMFNDGKFLKDTGMIAGEYVKSESGATKKVLDNLTKD